MNRGTHDRTGKEVAVPLRNALPRHELVLEDCELLQQHGGLDRVEPAVDAHSHVVVLVRALAVDPQGPQRGGHLVAIGEHCSAVAVAAERLGWKEARARDVTDRAGPPTAPAGA